MADVPQERPPDGGAHRPPDGEQPRHQHEEVPQPEAQAGGVSVGRAWIREQADRLREVPLEAVLAAFGAERDPLDRARWRTPTGRISVTPPKFMNWSRNEGGGGAIDLVMHLGEMDFLAALAWLEDHFPAAVPSPDRSSRPADPPRAGGLVLPPFDVPRLPRVRCYLIEERHLPARQVDSLLAGGAIRADARANAVFLMYAEDGRTIGAELRGTTARAWHSLARGSRRDRGYFSVPCPG
ncbi:MAG: DUF3991 domain-containing protein, partial [Candidatus Latescibacteria bacterium]|nr:DUF3991 domain-containing protein [Candidatus Latescibacterota bacterium]